ncbi:MAG: DUF1566 domain-containing protein [Proteobacteria bacterium]|nr:DUF1566 domain-containing protein [Pseudomonadota bacterium]MBU1582834.1 DUF1566 domain-containing protein [Pseudomonadota bacterium]MBU2451833.1 DUF1566 domain-containing protein [Pseudomonadota bacterium]
MEQHSVEIRETVKKIVTILATGFAIPLLFIEFILAQPLAPSPVVDTGQNKCYGNSGEIGFPDPTGSFYGQDAQYQGNPPSYRDNRDGTITDLVTGLMWSKAVDAKKVSLAAAESIAENMTLGGYTDWRVPNIKELYSLMNFNGNTGFNKRNLTAGVPTNAIPYINTDYFDFKYGNIAAGERYIDAQWLSSTQYVSTTMGNAKTLFGVNFADGRIKGYGYKKPGRSREKFFYARYVRGASYGKNEFHDNKDGTITDQATGMMWMQSDSQRAMNWADALTYAQKLTCAGYSDWRLPNAKELQYIVDYTRSPSTSRSPCLDPVFNTTAIVNEAGQTDYPFFWTSTTHLDGPREGANAVYISFGRAIGQMNGVTMDVHGAGAQRSDPKTGSPALGHGPQGDARRVLNYVRCVRGGSVPIKKKARKGPPPKNGRP